MKTILVPTDFSPISLQALDVAVGLAKTTYARVVLFHAVELPIPTTVNDSSFPTLTSPYDVELYQTLIDEATNRLDQIKKQSKYKLANIVTEVSDNLEGIERTIANHKADLIVMGSSGAKGIKQLLWGSHAEAVVRRAKCPVMVIKKPTQKVSLKKILFATDFTQTNFVKKTMNLLGADDKNAEFHFVYVNTPMNFKPSKVINPSMEKLAKRLKLTHYQFVIYNAFGEEDGILEYADSIQADFIVMPTHGRTGIDHALFGSIAEDVVNHSKYPVLTIAE